MLSDNEYLLKKNRILSRVLIGSGIINIAVLALFSYWITRERPPTPYCELKPKSQASVVVLNNPLGIKEHIGKFSKLSFQQLVQLLHSSQPLGPMFMESDLALGCLIVFHHFDLSRALKPHDLPLRKHVIKFMTESGKANFLTVYPDLNFRERQAIIQFAGTEKWPLTAQGLFLILKKEAKNRRIDPSLLETFALTPEFWSIELLLTRADSSITREKIAYLLSEGNWEMLKGLADQQSQVNDLSDARRRQILLDYIHAHSKEAAELLLKLDGNFALQKLDDVEILLILHLVTHKSYESERFAKELLTSPRSVKIWQKAAGRLYEYAGEAIPEDWDYQRVIARFIYTTPQQQKKVFPVAPLLAKAPIKKSSVPLTVPGIKEPQPKTLPIRLYTVQPGDTLWKIARKFNVSMDKVKELNQLPSDKLKPGMVLKIP
jgi:LysM repeat protein